MEHRIIKSVKRFIAQDRKKYKQYLSTLTPMTKMSEIIEFEEMFGYKLLENQYDRQVLSGDGWEIEIGE